MNDTQVNNAQAPQGDGALNGNQEVANLKDVLGPVFGTTFKSDEDALKSVEHAKNMAGKVGQLEKQLTERPSPDLEQKLAALESTLKQQTFYAEHPEFNTPEAKALIADMGGDAATVVEKASFKTAFEAIKVRNDIDKSKSILHTNPRLGNVQDAMSKASEAVKAGNLESGYQAATMAVLDAYGIK